MMLPQGMTARLVSLSDEKSVFALKLEHVRGSERDGFYCWCSPIVEAVEQAWIVFHKASWERSS